jgi:hypothetical protein
VVTLQEFQKGVHHHIDIEYTGFNAGKAHLANILSIVISVVGIIVTGLVFESVCRDNIRAQADMIMGTAAELAMNEVANILAVSLHIPHTLSVTRTVLHTHSDLQHLPPSFSSPLVTLLNSPPPQQTSV